MEKAFTIIFEDEHLLVINKIAKIVVQPTPKKEKYTLTSLLEKSLKSRIYPCHRLDKDTRGLMIYAKSGLIQKDIAKQFKKRSIKKKYFVLAEGNLKKKRGKFRSLVLDKNGKRFKEKPKKAETFYKVLKSCKGFDFLEVIPKTGRTNQIRIHFSEAGHPVLGEKKYAFRRDFMIKLNNLALFAYFLSFRHPVSQKEINLEIDAPEYMKKLIKKGGQSCFPELF